MKPYERTLSNGRAAAKLKVGMTVCAKAPVAASRACPHGRIDNTQARITFISTSDPGVVTVAPELHGRNMWNAEDLKRV